jgi:hypothetical protein
MLLPVRPQLQTDMIIMCMRANNDVLLSILSPIQRLPSIRRHRICFDILSQALDLDIMPRSSTTACIDDDYHSWLIVDLDVDERMLVIAVILHDQKGRAIESATGETCCRAFHSLGRHGWGLRVLSTCSSLVPWKIRRSDCAAERNVVDDVWFANHELQRVGEAGRVLSLAKAGEHQTLDETRPRGEDARGRFSPHCPEQSASIFTVGRFDVFARGHEGSVAVVDMEPPGLPGVCALQL